MAASPADYHWLSATSFEDVGYGCVLAQRLSPQQVLDRLSATHRDACTGLTQLGRLGDRVLERVDYQWGDFQLVGVAAVPGVGGPWAVMVEFGGMVELNYTLMTQVTAGTRAVSHHMLGGKGRFCSWRDGTMITWFEWPYHQRWGPEPDALNQAIAAAGVDQEGHDTVQGYFALAEHITGIPLTAELSQQLAFTTGIVALSDRARAHGWHWTDPDPAPDPDPGPMPAERAARERQIRDWARSQGIKVVPGGQTPEDLSARYQACQDAPPLWFQRPLP